MIDDPLDRISSYRPTPGTVAAEWPSAERARARAALLAGEPARRLRFRPARRRMPRALAPLAAGVAVVALIGGVVVFAMSGSPGGGAPAAGPSAGLSQQLTATDVPTDGQFAYRYDHQIDLDANGQPIPDGRDELRDRNWVSPGGDVASSREGSQSGCELFPREGGPSMEDPTRDFLAGLPTGVDGLTSYLRSHVYGSSSRDEAVFVAVGDALRTGDLLATSELRAALAGVLARTPGVTVHPEQRDFLGRPATRFDFVDEQTRPGEVHSLYFDPTTYQLLEERQAASGGTIPSDQPSPPYNAPPSGTTDTPGQLSGAAYVDVMVEEQVTDSIPFDPSKCGGVQIQDPGDGSGDVAQGPGPSH
jgi:hypothetical protein